MPCFHITTFYDLDLTSGRGRVAQSRLFAVYFARLSENKSNKRTKWYSGQYERLLRSSG